jgi:hypothetical protein
VITNSAYSVYTPSAASPSLSQKKQVIHTAILEDQGDPARWKNNKVKVKENANSKFGNI